jgi:drug/metabolite transporter (DMT)-like permease
MTNDAGAEPGMGPAAWLFTLVTLGLWSCTPTLLVAAGAVPPSLCVACSFLVAGLLLGSRPAAWRVEPRVLLMGGLCFAAYRLVAVAAYALASPMEVNLMASIQPVLVVLLPPLMLSGYRFRWTHLAAAACGLAGEALGVAHGGGHAPPGQVAGLLFALFSAGFWALYAMQIKRLQHLPSAGVGAFLLIAAVVSAGGCWADGGWRAIPTLGLRQWLVLIAFGIGPTGIGYLTWDAAIKRGDPRVVGGVMFGTPLLSTALLALVNHQPLSWRIGVGAVAIVTGAVLCAGQRRQAPDRRPLPSSPGPARAEAAGQPAIAAVSARA